MAFDIAAVGESLIDLLVEEKNGRIIMEGNAGGAVLNALAAATKYGARTVFIGKLSFDKAGEYLKKVIENCGIDCSGIVTDSYPTTLAVVSLSDNGDRSFSFYRKETSDVMLDIGEIDTALIDCAAIFHFGSVSLTCDPAREATFFAVQHARSAGKLISFDPNLREMLWPNLDMAKEAIQKGVGMTDLLKLSEEEFLFLTGKEFSEQAAVELSRERGLKLLAVTLAGKGAAAVYAGKCYCCLPPMVDVRDTTGAGDAFWGAFLCGVAKRGIEHLTDDDISEMLRFSVYSATLSTTEYGAISSYPTPEAVERALNN